MNKSNLMKGTAAIAMAAVSVGVFAAPTFDWVRTYTGAAAGFAGGANDIVVDASGNVYTISNSLNGAPGFEQYDIVVKKYSTNGTELWSTTIDGTFDVFAYDGDIDAAGNIYVAGLQSDDETITLSKPLAVKIDPSGSITWQSTHTATLPSDYYGYGIVPDGSGGAWLAGECEEAGGQYNAGLYRITSGGTMSLVRNIGTDAIYDYCDTVLRVGANVAAMSRVKGTGLTNDFDSRVEMFNSSNTLVWSNNYNSGIGESYEQPYDLATDGTNVYVSLRSGRTLAGTSFTNQFGMVNKINAGGATVWATELGAGATYVGAALTLDVNAAGEVFVASQASTTGAANSFDIQVNKLNASGSIANTQTYNNAANVNDVPADSKVDASGKYVVTGWVPISGVNRDMVLLGYTSAGASDYTIQYNNTTFNDWDVSSSVAVAAGAIYVGGYSDDLTTRYSTVLRYKTGETLSADTFTIITGTPFGGGVPELAASDDQSAFILNDENDLNGEAEMTTTTTILTPSSLKFTFEGAATRSDITQFVELFRYSNSTWQLASLSTTALADTTVMYTATSPAQMVGPAGILKARVRYIPQADLEAGDGWAESIDFVKWELE